MNRDRETYDRLERNRESYDILCAEADALLAKYNPCAGCQGCSIIPKAWDCCDGCPFLGPKGCTIQCLACKLWLCESPNNENLNRPQEMLDAMNALVDQAIDLNFYYARATPEEVLNLTEDKGTWFFYDQGRKAPLTALFTPKK